MDGMTADDMFPDSRKGSLHEQKLKELGVDEAALGVAGVGEEEEGDREREGADALRFLLLILPLDDVQLEDGTPLDGFFEKVVRYTNLYAAQLGVFGSSGHRFDPVTIDEIVRWFGIVAAHGLHGGQNPILERFDPTSALYLEDVGNAMTATRFLQIKRVIKTNDNTDSSAVVGNDDYRPEAKFELLWNCICNNTNALTVKAGKNCAGDESTWGFMGYGTNDGAHVIERRVGKPGVTKGGQLVVISDVDRVRLRAWMTRHTKHDRLGFNTSCIF